MNLIVDPEQIPEFNGLLRCCLLWQKNITMYSEGKFVGPSAHSHHVVVAKGLTQFRDACVHMLLIFSELIRSYMFRGMRRLKTSSTLHLHDLTSQFPAWPGHLLVHLRVAGAPICVFRVNVVFNFYVLQSNIVRAHIDAAVPP